MKSHKQKIEVLRKILIEYSKYFEYFSEAKVYNLGLRFAIKFTNYKPKEFGEGFLIRKLPSYDIDTIIARYRSKLHNEIKKYAKQQKDQMKVLSWCYSISNLK